MSKKTESYGYRAEAELASTLSHRLELEIASTEDKDIDKACVAQLATMNLLTGIQRRHGYSIDTMLDMVEFYLDMAAADDVADATTENILNGLMKNITNKD